MQPGRWLILADDLTGAADCAVAFARSGHAASVAWGAAAAVAGDAGATGDAVVAFDADSRRLPPDAAAARHLALLSAHYGTGTALFKKIDSTLRGQPAAELAGMVQALRRRGLGALSVMAPAFPAMGRTTEDGHVRVCGQALETTALWAREHGCATAHLPSVLGGVGLHVTLARLDMVRAGPAALAGWIGDALAAGLDIVVCDAVTQADLEIVAAATLPMAGALFWTGSGGLAQALAGPALAGRAGPVEVAGGILLVVGSVAEASRAASALLAGDPSLLTERIAPATLHAGAGCIAWQGASRRIAAALACGADVLVEIAAERDADLSRGAALARQLALLLRPAAAGAGAVFATGGETAVAVLDALGVTGIRMVDEIEPGVALGLARGAMAVPVVTKAGAFGDAGTLLRCLSHLRRHRRTENPP